jgi:hypothetical protein
LLKADEVLKVWMQVRSDEELSALSISVGPQYTRFTRQAARPPSPLPRAPADTVAWACPP